MIPQQKVSIYTQLANKYNIPYQVVEVICNHPFKFASGVISDPEDNKSIMFSYLFKIKLKKKYDGKKRNGESTSKIPEAGDSRK